MLDGPFTPWPSFSEEEANAAKEVLLSNRVNYWTGEEGRLFEKEFAEYVGIPHAVAVSSGSAALDLAMKALNLGPGDEVVVSCRTFIASVSSIVNAGATPVFADVDRKSQNITAETVSRVLTPRTRAIIAVHLAGWPCDMDSIMALAAEHDLKVIEDCAQAHGARYKGRAVGSIGDIGAWSFCQDKIMTTGGEGGMITTRSRDLWSKLWSLKDHGKDYDSVILDKSSSAFRWVHHRFGTNARITEMQAAIGRIQLRRMSEWHTARKKNALSLLRTANDLPGVRAEFPPDNVEHAWYKCYLFVVPEALKPGWNRERIMGEINRREVPCFAGICPEVYLERSFDDTGWRPQVRLPVARELGETSLMFLVHPSLSQQEIMLTNCVLTDVFSMASR